MTVFFLVFFINDSSFEIVDFYPERPFEEHHLDRIWWIEPVFSNSITSETQKRVNDLIKEQESKVLGVMIQARTDVTNLRNGQLGYCLMNSRISEGFTMRFICDDRVFDDFGRYERE